MRKELHELYERQVADPDSVTPADWARVQARLTAAVDQTTADHRAQQLPWVLPADHPSDPGVEPGAVQAMTANAPWTPRQPTETEQTLTELDQLDQEAGGLDGDAA